MLVFDKATSSYIIDPYYLTINPIKAVYLAEKKKEIGEAKLIWLYHMFNPHSPYRQYKNSEKSSKIVMDTFPKWYIDQKEKDIQQVIDEATKKNEQLSESAVTEGGKIEKPKKKEKVFVPTLRLYDPAEEELMEAAISWYRDYHLKMTPLWNGYHSYKEAIYNLSKIVADPKSSAGDIKTASIELDSLPLKMEKMRQQAEKDEAMQLKVQGDKNIKRSERLDSDRNRHIAKTSPG